MIKKVSLAALLSVVVFLAGCSAPNEEKIIGVWNYTYWMYDSAEKTGKMIVTDATYTFSPNNDFFYNGDGEYSGTYIIDGDTLTLIWKERGTTEQVSCTIEELTQDKLVISAKNEDEGAQLVTLVKNK